MIIVGRELSSFERCALRARGQLLHGRHRPHGRVVRRVTIHRSALPLPRYQTAIEQWLARLGGDGWTLMADVSGVVRHYKYTGGFVEHVEEELLRKQHYNGAEIFEHYVRELRENSALSFMRPTSRVYRAAEDLLHEDFLVASRRYRCRVLTPRTASRTAARA